MAQERVRILIEVNGGLVQEIHAPDFVDVQIVDYDTVPDAEVSIIDRRVIDFHDEDQNETYGIEPD